MIYCIDPNKQEHWHLHLCAALQELLGLSEPPHFLVPGYTATIDRWLDSRMQQIQISAEIYPLVRKHQALLNAVFDTPNLAWKLAPWQEGLCDPIVLETYHRQFPQLWEEHDLIWRYERTVPFLSHRERTPGALRQDLSLVSSRRENSTDQDFSFYSRNTHTTPTKVPSRVVRSSIQSVSSVEQDVLALKELPLDMPSTTASGSAMNFNDPNMANASLVRSLTLTEEADISQSRSQTATPGEITEIAPDSHVHHAQGYVLRLFVSGNSAATEYILMSLHQLLEQSLRYPYTLKVIDIFKHPEQAEANQISATPTLLRVWPHPVRRIVGDLTDAERVLRVIAAPESGT